MPSTTPDQAGALLNSTWGNQPSGIGSIFGLLAMLALVLVAAWLTTRFVATRGRGLAKGRFIQVKEHFYISKDKSVLLLEVGGKYFLVGATNQSMQLLGTLEKGELRFASSANEDAAAPRSGVQGLFQGVFASIQAMRNAPKELQKARKAATALQEQSVESKQNISASMPEKEEIIAPATKTQAEQKEKPAPALTLLDSGKAKGDKGKNGFFPWPKQEKPAEPEKTEEERKTETAFAAYLAESDGLLPLLPDDAEAQAVIVELTTDVQKEKERRGPRKQEKQAAEDDEIDQMMQAIEERRIRLQNKRGKDEDKR